MITPARELNKVGLIPMTEEEYRPWLEAAVRDYAEDHIKDGRWTAENALEESAKEFNHLLPEGLATAGNYLFRIYDARQDQKVGYLWFAVQEPEGRQYAFVYDFAISEPFRRRGYGSGAFEALEEKVRELGLDNIQLHVFGHNDAARALYKKLGYVETNVRMRKDLGGPGA